MHMHILLYLSFPNKQHVKTVKVNEWGPGV